MDLNKLLIIFFSAIFINNFIFSRFLGLCPFFGITKKLSSAVGMGITVIFVMVMSTLIIYPVQYYLIVPCHLDQFLQIVIVIFIVASFVLLLEAVLRRFAPSLYQVLGINLPMLTTNCAILGTAFIVIGEKYNLIESLVFAASAGLGFTLALIMMASVRERLERARMPKAFKELPIAFISAALMALAMYGFAGLVKG